MQALLYEKSIDWEEKNTDLPYMQIDNITTRCNSNFRGQFFEKVTSCPHAQQLNVHRTTWSFHHTEPILWKRAHVRHVAGVDDLHGHRRTIQLVAQRRLQSTAPDKWGELEWSPQLPERTATDGDTQAGSNPRCLCASRTAARPPGMSGCRNNAWEHVTGSVESSGGDCEKQIDHKRSEGLPPWALEQLGENKIRWYCGIYSVVRVLDRANIITERQEPVEVLSQLGSMISLQFTRMTLRLPSAKLQYLQCISSLEFSVLTVAASCCHGVYFDIPGVLLGIVIKSCFLS